MNVGPVLAFQPSTELQVAPGTVPGRQTLLAPAPGSGSTGENQRSQNAPAAAFSPQDVVKVQLEPPGEIVVYQFVDQQGTVVLQVPPQQLLDLAQQISKELARDIPFQSASEGGNDGH